MSPVVRVLDGKEHDLGGGFVVRRTLPRRVQRSVGPFVFWDEMGPATLGPDDGLTVLPHPHIGLATLTWLFEGAIHHRDSLGVSQRIVPGEVNLMVAGRGIVHAERSPDDYQGVPERLHGVQAWVALPRDHEEDPPAFHHAVAADLPEIEDDGARVRVAVGEGYGVRSPVPTFQPMLLAEAVLAPGARLPLPAEHEERAVYVVRGAVRGEGVAAGPGQMVVLTPGRQVTVDALQGARVMLLGGAPLDGPRHMAWNFVSSRRERVEQAKEDWRRSIRGGFTDGPFRLPPGEHEHIPLPGDPPDGPPPSTREQPTT